MDPARERSTYEDLAALEGDASYGIIRGAFDETGTARLILPRTRSGERRVPEVRWGITRDLTA